MRDLSQDMRLIYMAGKGGVGKSVCSAATALWASRKGMQTLAFSMDPAHSLSDLLEIEIGSQAKQIGENLDAAEPDINVESGKFYYRYKNLWGVLFDLFEFEIKPEDFGTVPGMGDLIFMDKLADIYSGGKYDLVVIDSAPTALLLPLLTLPSVTTGMVTKLIRAKSKWTTLFNMLQPGFGDAILADVRRLRSKSEMMRNALLNRDITTITTVMIPEKAAVMESKRLIQTVESHGVFVDSMIINHVMKGCDCAYCRSKRKSQAQYIDELTRTYADKRIATLPSWGEEIKGEALLKVAEELYEKGQLVI
jgi:arsenite-transporting ATPase